jgi:hypothetical protein
MVPASLKRIGYATSEKQSITQPQSARRAGGVFLGMKNISWIIVNVSSGRTYLVKNYL